MARATYTSVAQYLSRVTSTESFNGSHSFQLSVNHVFPESMKNRRRGSINYNIVLVSSEYSCQNNLHKHEYLCSHIEYDSKLGFDDFWLWFVENCEKSFYLETIDYW